MANADLQIAPIIKEQIQVAGEVLTQAFLSDPLCIYTFPKREERERAFFHFFLAGVQEGAFLHSTFSTVGQTKGAAVWTAPNALELTAEQSKQVGWEQVEMHFGAEPYKRFNDFYTYASLAHERTIQHNPHWYLSLLGVSPSNQHQGIGGALLAPVLQQADQAGIPCYLETFKASNVAFYQRHGFYVAEFGVHPQSQLSYWAMRREPKAPR